jgi:hypothetical protein
MFDDNNTPEQQEINKLKQQILTLKADLYDSAIASRKQNSELSQIYGTALARAASVFDLRVDGKLPNSVDDFHAAITEFEEADTEV